MRRLLVLAAFLLTALNAGCSLLPPQEPLQPGEERATNFRGGRSWTAPGGFDPQFWKALGQ